MIAGAAAALLVLAGSAAATERGDPPGANGYEEMIAPALPPPPLRPLSMSVRCAVLYTHEVPTQRGLAQLIEGLRAHGYQPTTLGAVDAAMRGEAPAPPGCLVLTFDDALLSQYHNALPALASAGAPGVFFAMPGFGDGVHRYMGPAELRAVVEAGHEVMAHTCNHASLPALLRRSPSAFLAEIDDCRRILERIVGRPAPYLAYPNGSYDLAVARAVAEAGYRMAFTTRPGTLLSAANPYAQPRITFRTSEAATSVVQRIRRAG